MLTSLVLGHEHKTCAVFSFLWHGNSLQENKLVRYLQHNARAVAGLVVGSFGATVAHVFKHAQGIVNQLMALVAMYVHHHADAASVVLIGGAVQS